MLDQSPHRPQIHPLADRIPLESDPASARAALGMAAGGPVIAVLPGSRGGEVSVVSTSSVATLGSGAHALFAQSVGGGGGSGGFSVVGGVSRENAQISASIGGKGGGGRGSGSPLTS